jgi:hypothetical protein
VFLSGCASERQNLELVEHAVDLFHSQLDSEDYLAIYQAAGANMKEATSESDFVNFMQDVHRTLGSVQNSVQKGTTFELAQGTIRINYDTTFAGGTAREQFVWGFKDDKAILYDYRIDSKDISRDFAKN